MDDFKRLAAASYQDQTGATPIEITVVDGAYYRHITAPQSKWTVDTVADRSVTNMGYLITPDGTDVSFLFEDIDDIIALLQRARAIMGGEA